MCQHPGKHNLPSLQSADISVLVSNLGTELLSYILNVDKEVMASLLADGGEITTDQQAALYQTEQVLSHVRSGRINNQVLEWHDTVTLAGLRFKDGRSVLTGLREIAGGETMPQQNIDPVKQALAEISLDCYPYTLLKEYEGNIPIRNFELPYFHGSEKLNRFIAAVREDKVLMSLFPDGANDDMDSSNFFYTSFGYGGSVQLVLLHSRLIESGIALMHVRGQNSAESLQSSVWEMLDVLRASLSGEKPMLPVFDIFDLVGLPEGAALSMGNSTLKGVPMRFTRHLPKFLRLERIPDAGISGLLLERPCEFNVLVRSPEFKLDFDNNWPIKISSDTDSGQRNAVSLATALAIEEPRPTAARWRASVSLDPLGGVRNAWRPTSSTQATAHVLSDGECEKLNALLQIIGGSDLQPIEMAISRFLSATTGRDNPNDSLVDAVIGLESLFGGRPEISLSVASGVANLLGEDVDDRRRLFECAKEIYDARSNLVHGNAKKLRNSTCKALFFRLLTY